LTDVAIGCHDRMDRLRGFTPRTGTFPEVGVNRPPSRSPLRIPPPSGQRPSDVIRFLGPSARDVLSRGLPPRREARRLASQSRLQRIATGRASDSVSGTAHLFEVLDLP